MNSILHTIAHLNAALLFGFAVGLLIIMEQITSYVIHRIREDRCRRNRTNDDCEDDTD